jgi:hypothetical protein
MYADIAFQALCRGNSPLQEGEYEQTQAFVRRPGKSLSIEPQYRLTPLCTLLRVLVDARKRGTAKHS